MRKMITLYKVGYLFALLMSALSVMAQTSPSGWTSRVLVLVQNPINTSYAIAPQYSLIIENATYGNATPQGIQYWPVFSGYTG